MEYTLFVLRSKKTGKFLRIFSEYDDKHDTTFYSVDEAELSDEDNYPVWTTNVRNHADEVASSTSPFRSPYVFRPMLEKHLHGEVEVVSLVDEKNVL